MYAHILMTASCLCLHSATPCCMGFRVASPGWASGWREKLPCKWNKLVSGWEAQEQKLQCRTMCPSNWTYSCEPFSPLQHSKTPRTPNLSKVCPDDCFSGFQSGGPKFVKNLSNNWKLAISGQIFKFSANFWQIWVPLIRTPKNNQRDKFWTNLGFGAFLNAVRGKRVRKPTVGMFTRSGEALCLCKG